MGSVNDRGTTRKTPRRARLGGRAGQLALVAVAFAGCGSKVAAIERWLPQAEAGDAEAIAEATTRADALVAAPKYAQDPAAWTLRGRAHAARASTLGPDEELAELALAVDSFEHAVAAAPAGGVHAELSAVASSVEERLVSGLVNDVEAKDWAAADQRLGFALRARAVTAALHGPDAGRDAALHRLGVLVTANVGRAAEARTHYEAFAKASGADETVLACLVAKRLAEGGDLAGAIAFVSGIAAANPEDESVLRTEVELRTQEGRTDIALARIESALPSLERSVSGAFLAASLLDAVGEPQRARAEWQRVIELDPRHVDARVALGRSLVALAIERTTELRDSTEELDQRRPSREVLQLVAAASQAWTDAETLLVAAVALDPKSRSAAEALVALYEGRIAGYDAESANARELAERAGFQTRLDAANAALAALKEAR